MEREKSREEVERNLFWAMELRFRKRAKKDPLAPYPRKAILTTQKAKWYCWEIEKYLVSEISRHSVAEEIRNMPARKRNLISATSNTLKTKNDGCVNGDVSFLSVLEYIVSFREWPRSFQVFNAIPKNLNASWRWKYLIRKWKHLFPVMAMIFFRMGPVTSKGI